MGSSIRLFSHGLQAAAPFRGPEVGHPQRLPIPPLETAHVKKSSMRNGKKRHQIVIQTIPQTRSASGASIPGTPVTFAELWAAIIPLGGEMNLIAAREQFGAGRQYAEALHRVETDYVEGTTPAMRVSCSDGGSFDGRTFDIQSVNPIGGKKREMHLIVKEYRTSATP